MIESDKAKTQLQGPHLPTPFPPIPIPLPENSSKSTLLQHFKCNVAAALCKFYKFSRYITETNSGKLSSQLTAR